MLSPSRSAGLEGRGVRTSQSHWETTTITDRNTPLGCVPGGVFAFWARAIFPEFPLTTAGCRHVVSPARFTFIY